MICLSSSDGEIFEVEEVVAAESLILKKMMEDGFADGTIPLPNVTSPILAKVIEYCSKHAEAAAKGKVEDVFELLDEEDVKKVRDAEEFALDMLHYLINEKMPEHLKELKKFDEGFVQVDLETLFDLMKAAHNLEITELRDLTVLAIGDIIRPVRG